ncbi:MAG: hypothetical protein P8Z68_00245 [Kineosporiaceae bacterium]
MPAFVERKRRFVVRLRPEDAAADRSGVAVVGLDGGCQLGLLRGRWTKPAAEHLGATARERAGRARLAELEMALDVAERDRAEAETELDRVAAAETRLAEQLRAWRRPLTGTGRPR